MNEHEFSVAYAKKAGITQDTSEKTCREIFDFLSDCIGTNDRVYIKGLGTFTHKKEDIKFMPYQDSASVPPDPMVSATPQENDISLLPQTIADSISKLGLPEFLKRITIMTKATKGDIYSIARRETTRETKLSCPCCGKEFYKRFSHQRFCSGRCREENARRARTEFSAYEHDHKLTGERNVTINL